jgi:hypothetical protein
MNNVAITPYIALHALQIQNVKRNVAKKVSINELNNQTFEINNNLDNEPAKKNEKNDTESHGTNINNLPEPEPEPTSLNETIGTDINNIN